jgi:AGCS family alanine or glycine:cation symporter
MSGLSEIVWGPFVVFLLLGTGLFFAAITLLMQVRGLGRAIGLSRRNQDPHGSLRTMVAASAGMGSIAGAALAVSVAGPGAILWMWITTVLGMGLHFVEATLGAAGRKEEGGASAGPVAYIKAGLGPLGGPLSWLFAMLAVVVALFAGGLFQTHQAAALLRQGFGTLPMFGAILVAVLAAPWILRPRLRPTLFSIVPALLALYVLLVVAAIAQDPQGAAASLSLIVEHGLGLDEASGGVAGGVAALAVYHGALRATFANESGLGTAAFVTTQADERPADAGLRAMLVPLLTTGLVGTLTALLVVQPEGEPLLAERTIIPLERAESRGLAPSAQVGQTVILPEDTELQPGSRYRTVIRSNPRGHRFGRFLRDEDAVILPTWPIASEADTLIFRDINRKRTKSAGWDIRVPCNRETFEGDDGAQYIRLTPTDPEVQLAALMKRYGLEGPYVNVGDYEFAGTVARAVSPRENLGDHVALFEERPDDAQMAPKLHEFFRSGYRGPYIEGEKPRPPWAFPSTEAFSPEVGTIVRLRFRSPTRGGLWGRVTQIGDIEAPPWDFLLDTREVVLRHDDDPSLDIVIPVTASLREHRVRLESADPEFADFRVVEEKMKKYSGPFLRTPPYDFEAEVHTAQRFPASHQARRALVPIHETTEPVGPPSSLPYAPHPGELLATDMEGPFAAVDGAELVAAGMDDRLGEKGRALLTLLAALFALTTLVAWSEIGARSLSHILSDWCMVPFRMLFLAVACAGGAVGLPWILEVADSALGALLTINLLALIALSRKALRAAKSQA